jgi:hypothetical protein
MESLKKLLPPYVRKQLSMLLNPDKYALKVETFDACVLAHSDAIKSQLFIESYNLSRLTNSWPNIYNVPWRCYVNYWAAAHALSIEGDFVECGTNRGGFSRGIVHYTNFASVDKKFYLFDTFQGIVIEQLLTSEEVIIKNYIDTNYYSECYEEVLDTFKNFTNVVLVRGKVPETFKNVNINKVSYLSIDMNAVVPEMEALNFFWDK